MTASNTAKTDILNAIRRQQLPSVELPSHDGPWIQFPDPAGQFTQVVRSVGGEVIPCSNVSELHKVLDDWEPYRAAQVVCSAIPGVGRNTFTGGSAPQPHDLQHVDLAIVPGAFGVAENGAVWVDDRELPQRVLPFLTQHLILLVPAEAICHNMHEAYQRTNIGSRPFGVFISGPSKTADIEQSLVIGAHGARSLLVILCQHGMP